MTLPHVHRSIQAMQAANQPHNLLFTPRCGLGAIVSHGSPNPPLFRSPSPVPPTAYERRFVYIFPKPIERPLRSFDLYPETVGGPELIGSWTLYTEAWSARHAYMHTHAHMHGRDARATHYACYPPRVYAHMWVW